MKRDEVFTCDGCGKDEDADFIANVGNKSLCEKCFPTGNRKVTEEQAYGTDCRTGGCD